MPRLLLIAVLALTQLYSYSGAPLYLCLGCDGTVGIDFGPTSCHHCQHKAKRPAAVCQHHCAHHRHTTQIARHSAIVHACGCRHIQLSQPNSPIVRVQRSSDQHRVVGVSIVHSTDIIANTSAPGPARYSPDNRFFFPAPTSLISSVVLRC
jgi:hypothetical protein